MVKARDEIRERVRRRLAEQRTLVSALLRERSQLRGSLLVRYMECGKAGCGCHTGPRHGPYYVLSDRSGGRGSFAYLDPARARRARPLVERYRAFRRRLQRLQRVNRELVVLLRRYQQAQLRRTGARLKVAVSVRT
ncbi:MAG TPA: DUF6788 family protein [Vicinamibacteria bacterium]|nr:DUF6788 family protein [Vicinamibacteria bacterium]